MRAEIVCAVMGLLTLIASISDAAEPVTLGRVPAVAARQRVTLDLTGFEIPTHSGARISPEQLIVAARGATGEGAGDEGAGDERGGGANISFGSFGVVQTNYAEETACPADCDAAMAGEPPCNMLLLSWSEDSFNPAGVDVFLDGEFAINQPGLPELVLPATNFVIIPVNRFGEVRITIEDSNTGDFDEVVMAVLNAPPMTDPTNLDVAPNVDSNGLCAVDLTFSSRGPLPDFNRLFINGVIAANLPLDELALFPNIVLVSPFEPGNYEFVWLPFIEGATSNVFYRGCPASTGPFQISCESEACYAPRGSFILQTAYQPSEIILLWVNGQNDYEAIDVSIDGLLIDTVQGDSVGAYLRNGPAGVFELELRADCPVGESMLHTRLFSVRPEPSRSMPILGSLEQSFDETTGLWTSIWINARRNSLVMPVIFRQDGSRDDLFENLASGLTGEESTSVIEAGPEDKVQYLFFEFDESMGQAFASAPIVAGPPKSYFVRSNCDGSVDPEPRLTDAVFLLAYLFQGGDRPACEVACDADGSAALNITDAVYLLTFLFQGGTPPSGWPGIDPVCEEYAAGELSCDAATPECEVGE